MELTTEQQEELKPLLDELLANFDDWELSDEGKTVKCAHIRQSLIEGKRIDTDKYFLDVVDKLAKKYGFWYEYMSNLELIRFDLFKEDDLSELLINGGK